MLCIWSGNARTTAQEARGAITTTTVGHVYDIDLLDLDTGETETFSYELDADDNTVALAAASFAAAWNLSNLRLVQRIEATVDVDVVIFEAVVDGEPFSIADGGGSGTWGDLGVTIPSSSPSDIALPDNYVGGILPINSGGDTVYIPPGTAARKYNLGFFENTTHLKYIVSKDSSTQIGQWYEGRLLYEKFKVGAGTVYVGGTASLIALDLGDSTGVVTVAQSGTALQTGISTVNLVGTALTVITNNGTASLGLGAQPGDVLTVTSRIDHVGGGILTIGGLASTVTLTGVTLNNQGGTSECWGALPTLNATQGATHKQWTGNITTASSLDSNILYNGAITITLGNYLGETVVGREINGGTVTHTNANLYGPLLSLPAESASWVYTNDPAVFLSGPKYVPDTGSEGGGFDTGG